VHAHTLFVSSDNVAALSMLVLEWSSGRCYSQAAVNNDRGDGNHGAALVTVVHDQAAALPEVEGPNGEGDAVAAEGDVLGM
jgi:hypothetical protein